MKTNTTDTPETDAIRDEFRGRPTIIAWNGVLEHARKLERERDAALRELAEFRADKERLDWLLKQGLCFRDADKFDPNWRVGNETEWLYGKQDARQAIDAAKESL